MRHHRYLLLSLLALCGNAVAAPAQDIASPQAQSTLRDALLRQEYFASINHAGLQAPNRALGIRTYFEADGLRVVARDAAQAPRFDWRLRSLRRGDDVAQLAGGTPAAHEAQVELRQGALVQRFENAADGLHSALRIDAAPRGAGALVLALDLGPARASISSDGADVRIAAPDGSAFRLDRTRATDAQGRTLALTAAAAATGELSLRIDDAQAAYPISVDTVITWVWDIRAQSDQVSAHFATSVAAIGDLNLDGIGDFAVGAPDWDGGQTDEGAVFIYYGRADFELGQWDIVADKRLEIDQASARFGTSLAAAGDINRDNVVDIVVGAPRFDNGSHNEGAAFVYSGLDILFNTPLLPYGQLEANRADAEMGASVAGVGDTDGDGFDDIVVGAPAFQLGTTLGGRAFLYRGGFGATFDATPDDVFSSDIAGERLGESVAGAGDTNGDGRADVLVGAPGGKWAELHRGGSSAPQDTERFDFNSLPGTNSTSFGSAVAGAGDVNGDGYADFLIAQPQYSNGETGEGAVFLYFGGVPFNLTPDAILQGNQANAAFGSALTGGGDINGDGYADIVIGAPHYSNGQNNEGEAFVYYGRPGAFPTTAVATFQIDQVDAVFGSSLALGDIDGDGYDDVLVGAPYVDYGHSDEGALFVYRGAAGTLDMSFDANLGGVGGGGQASDYFGFSVDGAGDVNGDGYSDVIVGAPSYDGGEVDEGRAYLYTGSASGLNTTPYRTFEANQAGAFFGYSVAGAGDMNGDGYADVIVGAPRFDQGQDNEGTAFVYLGGSSMNTVADARYEGEAVEALLGYSVAGAGDVNGDGYADVIVGAPNYGLAGEGRALIYGGGSGQLATAPTTVMDGSQSNSQFGLAVAGAGDVNGDGYADVIVSAPKMDVVIGGNLASDVGRVSLYLGAPGIVDPQADLQLLGNAAAEQFGYGLAGAGDVDGDGFDDVVIGAPNATTGGQAEAGRAEVHYGGRTSPLTREVGLSTGQQFMAHVGTAVDSAGDLNRDGYADLIVSAPFYDTGGADSGLVLLYYGAASGFGLGSSLSLNLPGGNFGRAVAGAGDINGDGFADVVVGAPFVQTTVLQPGIARVFLGGGQTGRDLMLEQLLDGVTHIEPWGSAGAAFTYFTVAMQASSPRGRERVKLYVEACPAGVDFFDYAKGCRGGESNAWADTGLAGIPLAPEVGPLAPHTLYHWRARVAYAPETVNLGSSQAAAPRRYGPWLRLQAQADNADVRVVPLASDTIFFDGFD